MSPRVGMPASDGLGLLLSSRAGPWDKARAQLCNSTFCASLCGHKRYSGSFKDKRRKEGRNTAPTDDQHQGPGRDREGVSRPERKNFPPAPLLGNASGGVLPSMHATRGAGRICFCAFFLFKNNLWFVCFYTVQISWLPMRHCSHTITPGD